MYVPLIIDSMAILLGLEIKPGASPSSSCHVERMDRLLTLGYSGIFSVRSFVSERPVTTLSERSGRYRGEGGGGRSLARTDGVHSI